MGYRDPNDWQEQLQASLRRAQEAIARGTTQQDQMVREWTENLRNAYPDWGRERWQRRLERKLRRRAEREAKVANASLFEGYLWLLGAIVLFIIALSSLPFLWWLIFPAAGLGSRGTRVIARHSRMTQPILTEPHPARASSATGATAEQQRAQRFGSLSGIGKVFDGDPIQQPAPVRGAAVQQDPRDVRVDAICDRILGELRTSPDAVKDMFVKPDETIAALRATCRNLTRRERDLRRFLSPQDDERLMREREALQKRISGELDDVTKMRLAAALAALDAQRDQRLELTRAAARFDAEHTRISYTLESLYTQVVRMRSADSSSVDVAGAGLRRSLDMLSHEVNALADALERVNSGEAERMRKVSSGPAGENGAVPPGAPGKREKA
ncbi:MAG: hypothetical protein E6J58_11050 [Deltaproteobacteria bacterium]|nr:MAG: hypothetical protein E6J67_09795 [Deltaproteobacteria bacterium]TMB37536.1 MAG: hypothetical protein E6J58_11050 [Deltaproteobacteria bacterium]